jgi:hypothetical protein
MLKDKIDKKINWKIEKENSSQLIKSTGQVMNMDNLIKSKFKKFMKSNP